MHISPSPTASNGRDQGGRFAAGNGFARGNPHARRAQQIRSALFQAVTDEDIQSIVHTLVEKAKAGDVVAAREVLDRCLGKPRQSLDMDMEVSPGGLPDFESMSDVELAEVIRAAGLKLPLTLERKIQLIEQGKAERASEQSRSGKRSKKSTDQRKRPQKKAKA